MSAPHSFRQTDGLTLAQIVALTGAEVMQPATNLDRRVHGIDTLDRAGPYDLTYLDRGKFVSALTNTHACACFVTERFEKDVPVHVIALRVAKPHHALIAAARALFPESLRPSSLFDAGGIAPTALVHPSARIESGVAIDPGAVIDPRVEIGSGTVVGPSAVIGPDVRIGRDCAIGPGVSVMHSLLGDRIILHPGCRIGQDGFGYLGGASGHQKIPQVGRVIIQDDVEIGANTTVDRGGWRDTIIGKGSKIDNLVQIAHNVIIGRHCVVVSQTGISGSTVLEDFVMLGGQVGLNDHITIGEGAQVAAQSGVISGIPAGERWGGYPARPMREWLRSAAATLGRREVSKSAGRTSE